MKRFLFLLFALVYQFSFAQIEFSPDTNTRPKTWNRIAVREGRLHIVPVTGPTIKVPTIQEVNQRVLQVASIASLTAISGSAASSVIVRDVNRGGTFSYAASGYTADNATVYPASGGGFWVRFIPDGWVQADWFDRGLGDADILSRAFVSGLGKIRLSRGRTYTLASKQDYAGAGKDLTIDLNGASIVASNSYTDGGGYDGMLHFDGFGTIQIIGDGLLDGRRQLKGERQAYATHELITISNCAAAYIQGTMQLNNARANALSVSSTPFVDIQDIRSSKPYWSNIFVQNSSQVYINNTYSYGSGDYEGSLDSAGFINSPRGGIGILVQTSTSAIITNNTILWTTDTGTKTEGCSSVVYAFNRVKDFGKDGIKVMSYPGYPTVTSATIANNIVENFRSWRPDGSLYISLQDVLNGSVTGNTARFDGSYTLSNRTYNQYGTGVAYNVINNTAWASTRSNVTFTGNTITNTSNAISIIKLTGGAVGQTNFTSDYAFNDASIQITDSRDISLLGVTCINGNAGNTGSGIAMIGCSNISVSGFSRFVSYQDGVYTTGCSNIAVEQNTFEGITRYFCSYNEAGAGFHKFNNNSLTHTNAAWTGNLLYLGNLNALSRLETQNNAVTLPASPQTPGFLAIAGNYSSNLDWYLGGNVFNVSITLIQIRFSLGTVRYIGMSFYQSPDTPGSTFGRWVRGDIVTHSFPGHGRPAYWQCTASGNNGATWRAISGNAFPRSSSVSANYTLSVDDEVIYASGAITITLPAGSGMAGYRDKQYRIKNTGTGTVTVSGTIDGQATTALTQNQTLVFAYDGSAWRRLN
ncbi:right-handed parallel beta-helix repeat-containing protein [Tellurirhabdus rosea]|uniref:right-handed parallel beta-helix repeat-containing protein n=1 Tax=Tellurirhabdus rosea TaxID=2674997 RepID=UPI002252B907|nr:right-handed parallel beta-helix repeat-containing protein [Tellurirhabdus rosea]